MPYSKKYQPACLKISVEIQAKLYLQLSRLEEAGFPAIQAFELLKKNNSQCISQIHKLLGFLKRGSSIADSGYRAGIFSEFDRDLLQAGEVSGSIGEIYKQLAKHYEQKVKRVKRIKSKCYLPLIVLVIALFIQPLPSFILNEIAFIDYLLVSVGGLLKIILFIYLIIKLPFWLTLGKLKKWGLKNLVYSIQLKLPFISSWLITRQLNEFLNSLGLMLAAGVDILDALPKSLKTIKNPNLRKQFDSVILFTQQGGSLVDALADIPEMDIQAIQLLRVGEKSGKLANSILHYVKIKKQDIDLQDDLLAEWIPRIFYFLVSIWVASSILTGNPISTADL